MKTLQLPLGFKSICFTAITVSLHGVWPFEMKVSVKSKNISRLKILVILDQKYFFEISIFLYLLAHVT